MTAEVLARASVSESLIPRTLQALQILDLLDEQGMPSKTLEGIRLAPEAEYKQRLAEWLQSAYADVLRYVDPAVDDETKLRDAFRMYNPVGQQPRMITLFLGLVGVAGLGPEKQTTPRRQRSISPQSVRVSSAGKNPNGAKKAEADPPPPLDKQPPFKAAEISEKALEYRLVDLMSQAADDREVMDAIVTVIRFLKTKNTTNQPG